MLGRHEDVEFVITLGRETPAGTTALVSYVLAAPGRRIDPAALTEYAARSLPGYMVPAAVVVLDQVPLTPVGKLDRRALPEPVFQQAVFRAPSTPLEEAVAAVFGEVLGAERIGLDDDLFSLGGTSLLATQVVERL
ncbi:AMP-binding enzyme [Nocardia sp. bgisy134]|uniref:AMP-binding enzyme n=1 Tax=unclassified Nocardia TaxID=2637762 RepID=UPI003D751F90